MDNNNQLDIIAITENPQGQQSLEVFSQLNNVFNSTYTYDLENIRSFIIKDWNLDGYKDLLLEHTTTDSTHLAVIFNSSAGFTSEDVNLLSYKNNKLLSFLDADSDGKMDVLVSPRETTDASETKLYINENNQLLSSDSTFPAGYYTNTAIADFNHDGTFDVFISKKNSSGEAVNAVFLLEDSIQKNILLDLTDSINSSFAADFNSDGLTDISLGYLDSTLINNYFLARNIGANSFEIDTLRLPEKTFIIKYADYDLDGDLDIFSFHYQAYPVISYFENVTPEENFGPSPPTFHAIIQKGNSQVLIWNESVDDHSFSENISYDIFLGENTLNAKFWSPNFDLESANRLKFQRGNVFYKNESTFNNLPAGTYYYGIQGIDNSLSALSKTDGVGESYCEERNIACGEFIACSIITEISVSLCKEVITSFGEVGVIANWYSEMYGYLGETDTLSYFPIENDTLYATPIATNSCEDNLSIAINIIEEVDFQSSDIIVCSPGEVELNSPFELDSIQWFSNLTGLIGSDLNETITVTDNDSIYVIGYLNECELHSGFNIVLDSSQVYTGDQKIFEIIKGSSINLNATGASTYSWSPPESLNDKSIANPAASPTSNTTYYVTGISENGCESTDSVQVIVKNEAFIPSLFTPNNDGNNDRLLVYGINESDVEDFQLIIFDRSGNKVYESNDLGDMIRNGWDGTNYSTALNTGIYYWQVRGKYKNGDPLLLNSEQKGKVFLTR